MIPVIKVVISEDNGGREIAALVWVTYPPAMNPRVACRRLMSPQSIVALSLLSFDSSHLRNDEIVRKDAHASDNFAMRQAQQDGSFPETGRL